MIQATFVHFRKRIAQEGIEQILAYSVRLHGPEAFSSTSLQDTTVQENNITYPTDAKLSKKVIDNCNAIAQEEGIKTTSKLQASEQVSQASQKGKSLAKKLRALAGRQLRELGRKLPAKLLETYQPLLAIYHKAITQKRTDKDKIYSLHKPHTACIATTPSRGRQEGKAHKKYEFGNEIGLLAASGCNFQKLMEKLKQEVLFIFFRFDYYLLIPLKIECKCKI